MAGPVVHFIAGVAGKGDEVIGGLAAMNWKNSSGSGAKSTSTMLRCRRH